MTKQGLLGVSPAFFRRQLPCPRRVTMLFPVPMFPPMLVGQMLSYVQYESESVPCLQARALSVYGNFDIVVVHLARVCQPSWGCAAGRE